MEWFSGLYPYIPNCLPKGSVYMPIVCFIGIHVNSLIPGQLNDFYVTWVAALRPTDQPCIHCAHFLTHGHGFYPRTIHFEDCSEFFHTLRRHCPVCKKTFGLLPEIVAPYQRVAIAVQETVVKKLASGTSFAKVAESIPSPLGPLSIQTLKRWYFRSVQQIGDVTTQFTALVLSQQPDVRTPTIPMTVRDRTVCFFYVLGERWEAAIESGTSAAWNALGIAVCLFAPSVSVNRVSYGLSPGHSP